MLSVLKLVLEHFTRRGYVSFCPEKSRVVPRSRVADSPGVLLPQGGDCAGFFMQWGLPKELLKEIWEIVAGDEGRLSQAQFLSCLYLMDLAKRGVKPLRNIPRGPFPPIAGEIHD